MWLERHDIKQPFSKMCALASFFLFTSHLSALCLFSAHWLFWLMARKTEPRDDGELHSQEVSSLTKSRRQTAANIKRSDWRSAQTKGTFLPRSVLCVFRGALQCLSEARLTLKQCMLTGGCATGNVPWTIFPESIVSVNFCSYS